MGTGVGEAMLLGAAMGGGSAALTGGDPLKGALLGGLTGGIGSGVSGALAGGAEGGTLAGTALGANPTAGQVATQLGVQGAGIGAGSQAAMLADQMAGFGTEGIRGLSSAAQGAIPSGALPSSAATAAGTAVQQTAIPGAAGPSLFADPTAYLKAHPYLAGASAMVGATGARRALNLPGEYDGPLKRFRFNPETYRPSWYAEGGIAGLNVDDPRRDDYDMVVGDPQTQYTQGMASGGISDLGTYSDGGRMLRGPGDGMSDSIPGVIANKRPARLADGEFVVPADVVSHLGNGSTDAGAKQLYSMMDQVRRARTGTKKQGREINPRKYMPA